MLYETILQLLDYIEFELFVCPDGLHLVDLQCANLGGIEQEVFATLDSVIDRLDIYWNDYFIEPIAEEFAYTYTSWQDLYDYAMANGGVERCPSLGLLKLILFGVDKSLEV